MFQSETRVPKNLLTEHIFLPVSSNLLSNLAGDLGLHNFGAGRAGMSSAEVRLEV